MKADAGKTPVWPLWLIILLTGAGVIITLFIGNIIVIGSKLGAIHRYVEWCFYTAVLLLSFILIIRPLFEVLFAPVVSLEKIADCERQTDHKTLTRVCKQILKSPSLNDDQRGELGGALERGSDLREPLATIIAKQKESAAEIIRQQATLAFVTTAICQNGRLDAVALLAINFRLVRSLVGHFGYRPALPHLLKIYAHIFAAALIAEGVEDLDINIPFIHLISRSAIEGITSSLLTLRVGFITQTCLLNASEEFVRSAVRRSGRNQAIVELPGVLKEGVKCLPGTIEKLYDSLFAIEENFGQPGSKTLG